MIDYQKFDKSNVNPYLLKLFYFVMNGYKLDDSEDFFDLGEPSMALKKCFKKKYRKLRISQDCMLKIIGMKKGVDKESHDLKLTEVIKLPEYINNPILVIQGNTEMDLMLFIEIERGTRKMCTTIDLHGNTIFVNQKKHEVYTMTSTHSRPQYNVQQFILSALYRNKVFLYDTSRITKWLRSIGMKNDEIEDIKSVSKRKYTTKAPSKYSEDAR